MQEPAVEKKLIGKRTEAEYCEVSLMKKVSSKARFDVENQDVTFLKSVTKTRTKRKS
jgi:hypothetical protein